MVRSTYNQSNLNIPNPLKISPFHYIKALTNSHNLKFKQILEKYNEPT